MLVYWNFIYIFASNKTEMETVQIQYLGITLTIEGNYYKGSPGDYMNESESPEFEIYSIHTDGNILELINDTNTLQQLILEKLR